MGSSADRDRRLPPPPPPPQGDADEDLLTEWDVDVFHDFDHSILNVFGNKDKKYKPTFTVINGDAYKRRYPMLYKHRKREDLVHFQNCIEAFGGKTYSLSCMEYSTSIPILFRALDEQLNFDIVRAWKRNEERNNRIPRDVFSERYILEILNTGVLPNLNEFRILESDFHPYDANEFLTGTFQWTRLRKLA